MIPRPIKETKEKREGKKEGHSLSSLAEEKDSRLWSGSKSPIGYIQGGRGFIQILKWVQNKPQASSKFLLIASLDLTPPGKGKGLRGQWLGPCSGSRRGVGGHRAWSLGNNISDSLTPPDRLLPSGCSGPASPGQDFLLSDGSVPLTGCICLPAVALLLPPQPRQEKHYFLLAF